MTDLYTSPELDQLLSSVSEWDKALIEQAIQIFGIDGRPVAMNDLRDLLPPMAWGMAGRVILSMLNRKIPPIREIAQVRSTSTCTHRKRIGLYVLTEYGQQEARARFHRTEAAA
jgi:hypothetical protein